MDGRRLSVTCDRRLQNAVNNKRMATAMEAEQPKLRTINKMFEQFFIVGAPPEFESNPHASILVSYPTQAKNSRQTEEVDLITSFCFPNGLTPLSEKSKDSKKTILNEYLFCLAQGSSQIFGVCVLFKASAQSFFVSDKSISYPFCLCFLTSIPFLTSHFQFLSYLALLLSFKVEPVQHYSTTDVVPSAIEAHMPPGLVKDENHPSLAVLSGLSGTNEIVDELDFYHSLPTTATSAQLKSGETYPIIKLTEKLSLALPLHFTVEENMAHTTFHALFSKFTIDEIIKLYTAMLCEVHIVFVSKNVHLLTMCIMGIVSLLKPFSPTATIVLPVLPDENRFIDFLDSPCPYIIGVTARYNDYELVVNLDTGEVYKESRIPHLPQYRKLRSDLQAVFNRHMSKITIPQRTVQNVQGEKVTNPEFIEFFSNADPYIFPTTYIMNTKSRFYFTPEICNEILNCFRHHFPKILEEQLVECFVTDVTDRSNPVTVINKDVLLMLVPLKEKPFYQRFLQTQISEVFCDDQVSAFAQFRKSVLTKSSAQKSQVNNSAPKKPTLKLPVARSTRRGMAFGPRSLPPNLEE